jgi:imidazolonepropionase-like amidohydrolase
MNKKPANSYFTAISILLLLTILSPEIRSSSVDRIVLLNGTLIDGTGAPPLFNAVVIIEDESITEIGTNDNIKIPADSKIINIQKAIILPGFINAHVHSGYNKQNLKIWAQSGVTTVRDLGGNPHNNLFTFRDNVAKDPQYARLIAAGPMVTVPNGYPTVPWGSPTALPVTSPGDARKKIKQLLDEGADIIKIALESGASFNRTIPILSLEEAVTIVDVAHKSGTVVSAHVLDSKDLEHALNAGVDDIAHMVWDNPDDRLLERVKNQGVYWVPTLELWYAVDTGLGDAASHTLNRFVQVGGQVALGTDYDGYDSPFDLGMPIREIKWMLAAGMTPMQVIVAATKNAAHVCNIENEVGTLEKGKSADILIVDGNPLDDINSLFNKRMVICRGKIIYQKKKSVASRRD